MYFFQLFQKDLETHRSNMEALENARKRSSNSISWDMSNKMRRVHKKWHELLQKNTDRYHELVETRRRLHYVSLCKICDGCSQVWF